MVVVVRAGLRQRKKERTRRALADAATRLFAERGYEATTIADLAEAADISPRTFFSYFPSKEDVLFADLDDRIAALSELVLRQPGEHPLDALQRIADEVAASILAGGTSAATRTRMAIIESRPSLRAAALARLHAAEQLLSRRLKTAYPDELDAIEAAVMVGAATSALRAAAEAEGWGELPRDPRAVLKRVQEILHGGLQRGLPGSRRSGQSRS